MITKACTKCKQEKPIDGFNKGNGLHGRYPQCRECQRITRQMSRAIEAAERRLATPKDPPGLRPFSECAHEMGRRHGIIMSEHQARYAHDTAIASLRKNGLLGELAELLGIRDRDAA